MTRRTANLLTLLFLLSLFAGVSATAPRWARTFQQPMPPAADEIPPSEPAEPAPAVDAAEAQRTINVKLFFSAADSEGLVMEDRKVAFSAELPQQLRSVLTELVRGPQGELLPTFAPETQVLDVFVTARGVAYVDFSKEATLGHAGGSDEELRSVYSVVNTVTANFPAIRRVQILVDDRPAITLAGHVDLSRPLPQDMTLLAASTLTPIEAGKPGAPQPAPSPAS
jgi:spore germination protein GerM